jgi:hypothetical protein
VPLCPKNALPEHGQLRIESHPRLPQLRSKQLPPVEASRCGGARRDRRKRKVRLSRAEPRPLDEPRCAPRLCLPKEARRESSPLDLRRRGLYLLLLSRGLDALAMSLPSNGELERPNAAVRKAPRAHNRPAIAAQPDQASRPLQALVSRTASTRQVCLRRVHQSPRSQNGTAMHPVYVHLAPRPRC